MKIPQPLITKSVKHQSRRATAQTKEHNKKNQRGLHEILTFTHPYCSTKNVGQFTKAR